MIWDGLTPPYRTVVADPPWRYDEGWPPGPWSADKSRRRPLDYSSMPLAEVASLPVAELAAPDAHLYLWTTNRYLRDAYAVAEAWGFAYSATLVWCKPLMGWQPGGAFGNSAEFVLFARRGRPAVCERQNTTWFQWPRGHHSEKPAAFFDLVERVSAGPYVELFARAPRLGWDHWGHGYEVAS